MACKRSLKGNESICDAKKSLSNDIKSLQLFTEWIEAESFHLNKKVCITKKDVSSGWGMVATEKISAEEVLFTIPRKSILCPQNSSIKHLLDQHKEALKSTSGWVELLLVLMQEHTNPSSNWSPYFGMVPSFEHLHMPMFWTKEEVAKELGGTSLTHSISSDLQNLTHEFKNIILPFINEHPTIFKKDEITLDLFKNMVAFVMAYSFTEPAKNVDDEDDEEEEDEIHSPPIMVPLADILNHVSKHNAQLKFSPDHLSMHSTKIINAGEEVYNTYGHLSNQSLLHMYGYAHNPDLAEHDSVDLSMDLLLQTIKDVIGSQENGSFLQQKWNHLSKMEMVSVEQHIVLGRWCLLNGQLLQDVFNVMTMDQSDFKNYVENDGWKSDNEEDEDCDIFNYENIHKLPETHKQIIKKFVECHLTLYPYSLEEDEGTLVKLDSNESKKCKKSCIKLYSCYLRVGQMKICNKVLKSLNK